MRKIFFLILILSFFKSNGQVFQIDKTYGREMYRLATNTLFSVPTDTFSVPSAYQNYAFIARKNLSLYFWNTSSHVWAAFSASGIDTTSLSNRINQKVNISDTATMLLPYITDFEANAIFALAARAISTGTGLAGGGNLSADRTIRVDTSVIETKAAALKSRDSVQTNVNLKADKTITFSSGTGIGSGLGDLSSNRTVNVDTSVVLTKLAGVKMRDSVQTNVNTKANSSVTITAGVGLSGGGNLTANMTLDVDTSKMLTKLAGVKMRDSVQTNVNLKADKATTITINGTTQDISTNRSWTITTGGTPAGSYGQIQLNRNGAFAAPSNDSLRYDSVLRVTPRVYVSDSIFGLNILANGSIQAGDSLPSNKVALFFGNSVTMGYNLSSPTTERWASLLSHNFGWSEYNRALSGTRLTHSGVSSDSCMIDRLALIPTYSAATYSAIFFDYGLNDDTQGVDTTTFKTGYARVVDTCTARGWPVSKIYLLTPNYHTWSGSSHTANFRTAILNIAASKSVNGVDVYNFMRDHNGAALLQVDSLHPTAAGHALFRNAISQYLKTTFKRVGDLVVTGTTTANSTIYTKTSGTSTGGGIFGIDDTNTGIAINSGNADQVAIFTGGAAAVAFTRNFMQGDANFQYAWTTGSSGGYAGGPNVGIASGGASIAKVTNGSTGKGSLQAYLTPYVGTTAAGTAPLKFTVAAAANMTTPEIGAVEADSTDVYYTARIAGTTSRYTIDKSLTASATLDFANTTAQLSTDLTITVTGAAGGDVVSLGVPNASVNANTCYTAWVSASNTVTVRFNNYSSGAVNPASGTFKVRVIK